MPAHDVPHCLRLPPWPSPPAQSDREFVELLAKIRAGTCPQDRISSLLATCQRPLPIDDGILPTQLYTHRCGRCGAGRHARGLSPHMPPRAAVLVVCRLFALAISRLPGTLCFNRSRPNPGPAQGGCGRHQRAAAAGAARGGAQVCGAGRGLPRRAGRRLPRPAHAGAQGGPAPHRRHAAGCALWASRQMCIAGISPDVPCGHPAARHCRHPV